MSKGPKPTTPDMPDLGGKGLGNYFREVKRELKKVVWPTKEDTLRLTIMVLIVCTIFVVYLMVLGEIAGLSFDKLMGIKK